MMRGCKAVRDRTPCKRASRRRGGRTYTLLEYSTKAYPRGFPLSGLEDMPISPYRSPRVVRLPKRALS